MPYLTLPEFDETGFVVVDPYDKACDPREWEELIYVDWKSSGDTRFSPLASAFGEIECDGFWNHNPPRTDKDGIWVKENVAIAPHLTSRAKEISANIGRCRVIELQPNSYSDAIYNLHRDDNNRLNPEGTGWIVRAFFNLTDNPDSLMILREDKDDPATETRVPLPAGAQVIIDTQRLFHAVWHPGAEPRYCLITSYESGPGLGSWLQDRHPQGRVESPALDPAFASAAYQEAAARQAARDAARAAGSGNSYESSMEVLSEA